MSTSITDSQFSFVLPSLSYIDTHLEEQNIYAETRPARSGGVIAWLTARVAAHRDRTTQRVAMAELDRMTDLELRDIGLNRGDFFRLFNSKMNEDLRARAYLGN